MADLDILGQLAGPYGALAATATAAVVLWRRNVSDAAAKEALHAKQLADKEVQIEWERARTKEAEERLDRIGGTMTRATAVMERSVDVAEKAVDKLQGPS